MGQIVTLTTDWGYTDFFAGKVKGRLCSFVPDVNIIDITHGIQNYDLVNTAFVVANTCFDFPKGTIHMIDVHSTETPKTPFVIVECEGQYFICTDNGVPSMIVGERDFNAVQIRYYQDSNFFTFAAYNLFCFIVKELVEGTPISELGIPVSELKRGTLPLYTRQDNSLRLTILYVDTYGNGYLNIKYDEFEKIRKGRNFYITIADHRHSPMRISSSYEETYLDAGTTGVILTVSVTGYLQIAMKYDSAAKMLGLSHYNYQIQIDFDKD